MRWKLLVSLIVITVLLLASIVVIAGEGEEIEYEPVEIKKVDHTEFFKEANITEYEGSKTCISCHEDEVYEVFHSYHYQMASQVNDIAGRELILFGGRFAYNDFCGAIFWRGQKPVNWIGKPVLKKAPEEYKELEGKFIGLTGCSMCHGVGMGLPPSFEETKEQLNNIDCLACHVDPKVYMSGPIAIKKGLKDVYKDENGKLRYKINIDIWTIAKSITDKTHKDNCLACHAFSGGGPHLKRPNLSPDLLGKVDESFDIHMAKGLSCIDCHPGDDHGFPAKAADSWSREEGISFTCEDCHTSEPHGGVKGAFINTFHDKVACQTCHIPYIAHGDYPTALWRDWSAATFHPEMNRWKFSIPDLDTKATDKWYLAGNVTPVYAWYNGKREVYVFPEKVEPIKNSEFELTPVNGESLGAVYYVKPVGSKDDPDSRIYPFKLHRAIVPYSIANKTLVPIKAGIAFTTGNVTLATLKGAEATGIKWEPGKYVTLIRFMQVDHGVKPAEDALSCLNCHGPTIRRMNWAELGYGYFPEIAFIGITGLVVAVVAGSVFWLVRRRRH
ncbi:MAG: hypothetical protein GSR85_04845 [Desulfurococcales archaeon]|nr:hypothetical protein [Desulfurococcales archaeon]